MLDAAPRRTQGAWGPEAPAVADQAINASTTALVAGSKIRVPASGLQVGTILRWRLTVSKTAAGTAAVIVAVQLGTLGTTGDADILTFTLPVGTAAIDTGVVEIECSVRTIGATGVVQGVFSMRHNLSATGLANVPVVVLKATSGAVNMNTAALIASLAITTPASTVWTVHQASGEAVGL